MAERGDGDGITIDHAGELGRITITLPKEECRLDFKGGSGMHFGTYRITDAEVMAGLFGILRNVYLAVAAYDDGDAEKTQEMVTQIGEVAHHVELELRHPRDDVGSLNTVMGRIFQLLPMANPRNFGGRDADLHDPQLVTKLRGWIYQQDKNEQDCSITAAWKHFGFSTEGAFRQHLTRKFRTNFSRERKAVRDQWRRRPG